LKAQELVLKNFPLFTVIRQWGFTFPGLLLTIAEKYLPFADECGPYFQNQYRPKKFSCWCHSL